MPPSHLLSKIGEKLHIHTHLGNERSSSQPSSAPASPPGSLNSSKPVSPVGSSSFLPSAGVSRKSTDVSRGSHIRESLTSSHHSPVHKKLLKKGEKHTHPVRDERDRVKERRREEAIATRRRLEKEELAHKEEFRREVEADPARIRYGLLEHSGRARTEEEEGRKRIRLTDISRSRIGETVLFQARVHSSRALSAKLAFLVFRQQLVTVQGVLVAGATEEYGDASAEHNAPRESGGEAFVDAVKPLRQQGRERGISDEALEDRESSDEALDSDSTTFQPTHASADVSSLPSTQPRTTTTTVIAPLDANLGPSISAVNPAVASSHESPVTVSSDLPSSSVSLSSFHYSTEASSTIAESHAIPSIAKNVRGTTRLPPVSEVMVRWAEKLPAETVVLVEGIVCEPNDKKHEGVKSAEVHDVEIQILKIKIVSEVTESLPFAPMVAGLPAGGKGNKRNGKPSGGDNDFMEHPGLDQINGQKTEHKETRSAPTVNLRSQIDHRAIALRTADSVAIFRLVSTFGRAARSYLDRLDFIEIHSPKLQQGATESGASVFKVEYFGRDAFLAQSPQLAKEMAVSAFDRVYEIGPVFRAENSNTHRHLTEYTGVDLESTFDLDYHEVMWIIDGMLKHIFRTAFKENRHEIDVIKRKHPSQDLVFPDETIVLTFKEGVQMLIESGWTEDGVPVDEDMGDLSTRGEVELGRLVKEKFNTDYYILDKFPAAVRPFYTMADPDDPKYSNSFDIFVRGEEILSGGQRLHSAKAIKARLKAAHIPESSMPDYIEAFEAGMPPHAGGGIGLERLVMLFAKLGNIRLSAFAPRDPKSFPPLSEKDVLEAAAAAQDALPVPTRIAGWKEGDNIQSKDTMRQEGHPKLEDLISRFGDSTNTAYSDPGYEIWREAESGYAIGFVESKGHAVTWGLPLCEKKDMSRVIKHYIQWLHDTRKLSPIWCNADERAETILAREHNWRAVAVTTEQRVDPSKSLRLSEHKDLEKKVRQAQNQHVTVEVIDGEINEQLRAELEEGMRAWQEGRTGSQIHTTQLRPFSDREHRTYIVARNEGKKACGLLVLHRLSPEHGFQVKWSLSFPGAPSGTSEFLVTSALQRLADAGVKTATFGAGAADKLKTADHISGAGAQMLAKSYKSITKVFGLTRKSEYRRKFGSNEETLYVAYPPHGLGLGGISAIMDSLSTEKGKEKKNVKETNVHHHRTQTKDTVSTESSDSRENFYDAGKQ